MSRTRGLIDLNSLRAKSLLEEELERKRREQEAMAYTPPPDYVAGGMRQMPTVQAPTPNHPRAQAQGLTPSPAPSFSIYDQVRDMAGVQRTPEMPRETYQPRAVADVIKPQPTMEALTIPKTTTPTVTAPKVATPEKDIQTSTLNFFKDLGGSFEWMGRGIAKALTIEPSGAIDPDKPGGKFLQWAYTEKEPEYVGDKANLFVGEIVGNLPFYLVGYGVLNSAVASFGPKAALGLSAQTLKASAAEAALPTAKSAMGRIFQQGFKYSGQLAAKMGTISGVRQAIEEGVKAPFEWTDDDIDKTPTDSLQRISESVTSGMIGGAILGFAFGTISQAYPEAQFKFQTWRAGKQVSTTQFMSAREVDMELARLKNEGWEIRPSGAMFNPKTRDATTIQVQHKGKTMNLTELIRQYGGVPPETTVVSAPAPIKGTVQPPVKPPVTQQPTHDPDSIKNMAKRMANLFRTSEAKATWQTILKEQRGEIGPKPQFKPTVIGKPAKAWTEDQKPVDFKYAVVEMKDITASHDANLTTNPVYPKELQPRMRDRQAYDDQVRHIIATFNPELLGHNPIANHGAPMVGKDGVVEIGNGRTIALSRIYEQGLPQAEAYKKWLAESGEQFGYDGSRIANMNQPVLVRVRETDVGDRTKFTQTANVDPGATMSSVEIARIDAQRLVPEILAKFIPGADGKIDTIENQKFVRAYIESVAGRSEMGDFISADGTQLIKKGIDRIRNAIFAKVYENVEALEKLAEDKDTNVQNQISAMLRVAPDFLVMKDGIEKGDYYPLDITKDIGQAVNVLSSIRDTQKTQKDWDVDKYLAQPQIGKEDLNPIGKDILVVLDRHKRSANKIAAIFKDYAYAVERMGDPAQVSMFEKQNPTVAEVFRAAVEKVEGLDEGQLSLFADAPARSRPDTEVAGRTEGVAAREPERTEVARPETPREEVKPTEITPEQLTNMGQIRPSPSTFGQKVGRWQYKDEKGTYTTVPSKEEAVARSIEVLKDYPELQKPVEPTKPVAEIKPEIKPPEPKSIPTPSPTPEKPVEVPRLAQEGIVEKPVAKPAVKVAELVKEGRSIPPDRVFMEVAQRGGISDQKKNVPEALQGAGLPLKEMAEKIGLTKEQLLDSLAGKTIPAPKVIVKKPVEPTDKYAEGLKKLTDKQLLDRKKFYEMESSKETPEPYIARNLKKIDLEIERRSQPPLPEAIAKGITEPKVGPASKEVKSPTGPTKTQKDNMEKLYKQYEKHEALAGLKTSQNKAKVILKHIQDPERTIILPEGTIEAVEKASTMSVNKLTDDEREKLYIAASHYVNSIVQEHDLQVKQKQKNIIEGALKTYGTKHSKKDLDDLINKGFSKDEAKEILAEKVRPPGSQIKSGIKRYLYFGNLTPARLSLDIEGKVWGLGDIVEGKKEMPDLLRLTYANSRDAYYDKFNLNRETFAPLQKMVNADRTAEKDGLSMTKEWENVNSKVFKLEGGRISHGKIVHNELELSVAEMGYIYMSAKNDETRAMLLDPDGGVRTVAHNSPWSRKRRHSENKAYRITESDMNQIVEYFKTKYPKAAKRADHIFEAFNTSLRDWVNDKTVEILGYPVATVPNYVPRGVSKHDIRDKDTPTGWLEKVTSLGGKLVHGGKLPEIPLKDMGVKTFEAMGLLQPRIRTKGPVLVEDMYKVFVRYVNHASDIPFIKVYRDYEQVFKDKDLANKLGDLGLDDHVAQLNRSMEMIATYQSKSIRDIERVTGDLIARFTAAKLMASPWIPPIQAISLVYFQSKAPVKYYPHAFVRPGTFKEIKENSPYNGYGRLVKGYMSRTTGELMDMGKLKQELTGKKPFWQPRAIRLVDTYVVGSSWEMVKAWVKDVRPDLSKEEQMKLTAEAYDYGVDATQPTYLPHTRGEITLSRDPFLRPFTMFMSQKNKIFNEVTHIHSDYQRSDRSAEDKTSAIKALLAWVVVGPLLLVARDYLRDYIKMRPSPKTLSGIAKRHLRYLLGSMGIGGDVIASFIGRLDQSGFSDWYDVSNPIYDAIDSMSKIPKGYYDAYQELLHDPVYRSGEHKGEKKWTRSLYRATIDTLDFIDTITGMPFKNYYYNLRDAGRWISPELQFTIDTLGRAPHPTSYYKRYWDFLTEGSTKQAERQMYIMMHPEMMGRDLSAFKRSFQTYYDRGLLTDEDWKKTAEMYRKISQDMHK